MSKSGSKRTSNPAPDDEETKCGKQPKTEVESSAFTGTEFLEDEGTCVYTDGACFFNGKHGQVAGVGVFWAADDTGCKACYKDTSVTSPISFI